MYKLSPDHKLIWCVDEQDWLSFMNSKESLCRVGIDKKNGVTISTTFIGVNGTVFESLVFGNALWADNYDTWDEAVRGHYLLCLKYLDLTDEEKYNIISEHFIELL